MSTSISRRKFLGGGEFVEGEAAVAAIAESCFAARGVYCRSCADVCDQRAIRIAPLTGGRAQVKIDADLCSACGECAEICPASAISTPRAASASAKEGRYV